MRVHLVDGTYELFRHFFAVPPHADQARSGAPCSGSSIADLDARGARRVGATDHVIESFETTSTRGTRRATGSSPGSVRSSSRWKKRSRAWPGRLADGRRREADDAIAAAARRPADRRVRQVIVCSPTRISRSASRRPDRSARPALRNHLE
jgi:hypothetical protein